MKKQDKDILFFVDSMVWGGSERVIAVLSHSLADLGYSVSIVMLDKRDIAYGLDSRIHLEYVENISVRSKYGKIVQKAYKFYNVCRQQLYKPILLKLGRYNSKPRSNETTFFFYANYAIPYREMLKKYNSCIALGFLARSNIALLQATSTLPNVTTIFCERNNPIRPDLPKNIVRLRDKYYHRADIGVFQTDEQRDYYTRLRGKKYVIPNPVKDNLPLHDVNSSNHEIVNFCRISEQKNLKLLVDAYSLLIEDYPEYTVRIYGKGEYEPIILDYIKSKGLDECITIEPFTSDIHERVQDAAIFVSTSDFEGISNSMIEAMAMGLPCVCTDCDGGGARMMIKDHENGLLVPKGDTNAVYRAMKEIIENKMLSMKLSQNAKKIRYEYSADCICSQWIKIMEEIKG